jgi:predicted ATPase
MRSLKDAYKYQMLLIDEPESSFDNMFLREEINKTIKEMSEHLPVVIVTHNHTVGLSIKPDYIFHLIREDKTDGNEYFIFSGLPDAAYLNDKEGKSIKNYVALMNSFESGEKAYEERKVDIYDVVKNRG